MSWVTWIGNTPLLSRLEFLWGSPLLPWCHQASGLPKKNPSAKQFTEEIASIFEEEKAMGMVIGPFTQDEAAKVCDCLPDQLCPGPMAGIQEADKIRTIFDGSWSGANPHPIKHCGAHRCPHSHALCSSITLATGLP